MKITKQDVEYIAGLAMLKLNDEEIEKYERELEQISVFVEKLNEVDVSNVTPTAHILELNNVFRRDESMPSYEREEILKNAPSKSAGCYVVPKVMD